MDEGGERDEPISAGKQEMRRRRKLSQPMIDHYQQTDAIEKKKLGSARYSEARDTSSGQDVASKMSQTDHAPSGPEDIVLSSQLRQSWKRRKRVQDMVDEVQQTDKIQRERKKKPKKASPPLTKKESVLDVPPEPVIEVPQVSQSDDKEYDEVLIQVEEKTHVPELGEEEEQEEVTREPEVEAPIPEPEEEKEEEVTGQPAEEALLEEEKPEEEPEVPLIPEESSFLINRSQQTSCTGDLELFYNASSKKMVDKWQQTNPSLTDVPKFVRHSRPASQASISKTPERAGPEAPAGEAAEAQGLDHVRGGPRKTSATPSAEGGGPETAAAETGAKPPETAAGVEPSEASVPESPGEEAGQEASAVETVLHPAEEAAGKAPSTASGALSAKEAGLDTPVAHVDPEAEVPAESPAAETEGSASGAPPGGTNGDSSGAPVTPPQDEASPEAPAAEPETPSADTHSLGPEGPAEAPVAEEETPVAEGETPVVEEEAPVAEEEIPVAEEETPMAKEETPVAKEETPEAPADLSSGAPSRAPASQPADGDGPEAVVAESQGPAE
ncbi:fibrous sheath CABYR-binding protein-like [Ornithorhynchus anatinus]|uniref:fibrous sheath CABYR-binding protein-like n=1 Tax=Ornithorhynchus anatinus TaxID=9258 RepID=UPI0010A809A1|nr:fibrous sheath CABYR-binding protein-like [Ornithorhynchus anatinus]